MVFDFARPLLWRVNLSSETDRNNRLQGVEGPKGSTGGGEGILMQFFAWPVGWLGDSELGGSGPASTGAELGILAERQQSDKAYVVVKPPSPPPEMVKVPLCWCLQLE